jgi:hypothetical protein
MKKSILILGFMIIVMGLIATGYIKTEFVKKPYIKEQFQEKNYQEISNFYLSSQPHYNTIPYYGNESAQIELIVYADLTTNYLNQTFDIFKTYINEGRIKYYHLPYIENLEDLEKFKYAQLFACISKEDYYDLFFEFNSNFEVLKNKFNISEDCLNETQENVLIWASEVQNKGMVGTNPWIYIGLKGDTKTKRLGGFTPTQLENTIRNLEIQIGI